jgi:hypothetical protein
MKFWRPALCALALTAGVVSIAAPAMARPLHVIVRGANPILPPEDYGYAPDYYPSNPYWVYGENEFDPNFRPAGKIPDWRYYGPPAVDMVLARTLDINHESILSHMLHCEAAYRSYNAATNFYIGRHGLPTICYR